MAVNIINQEIHSVLKRSKKLNKVNLPSLNEKEKLNYDKKLNDLILRTRKLIEDINKELDKVEE